MLSQDQWAGRCSKICKTAIKLKHGSTTETKNLVEFYYANLELEWSNNFVLKLSKFLNQKNTNKF